MELALRYDSPSPAGAWDSSSHDAHKTNFLALIGSLYIYSQEKWQIILEKDNLHNKHGSVCVCVSVSVMCGHVYIHICVYIFFPNKINSISSGEFKCGAEYIV